MLWLQTIIQNKHYFSLNYKPEKFIIHSDIFFIKKQHYLKCKYWLKNTSSKVIVTEQSIPEQLSRETPKAAEEYIQYIT